MALTGTLRDFGIAEILQLIGTQMKTGVLTLKDDDHCAEIDFSDGLVVGARGGMDNVSMEERLVRSGLITREQYELTARKVKETLKPFSTVILEEGMLDLDSLRDTMALHISEIVYGTFSWKSGTYEFELGFMQWDKRLVTPLKAESIMMDGLRIVDETPSVMKHIPSLDVAYVPSSRIDPASIELSREERTIINMLNGQNTVQDIIYGLRQPRFDVLKQMAQLRQNGFIEPSSQERTDESSAFVSAKINKMTQASVYVLLVVMALVAMLQIGRAVLNFAHPFNPRENSGSVPGLLKAVQASRIRNALEVYRLRKGVYPDSLENLVETGILKNSDLTHPRPGLFKYNSDGKTYTLDDSVSSVTSAPRVAEESR